MRILHSLLFVYSIAGECFYYNAFVVSVYVYIPGNITDIENKFYTIVSWMYWNCGGFVLYTILNIFYLMSMAEGETIVT